MRVGPQRTPAIISSERAGEHQGRGDQRQEDDQADVVVNLVMPGHLAGVDPSSAGRQFATAVVARQPGHRETDTRDR